VCVEAWILSGGSIGVAAIAGVLALASFLRLAAVAWATRCILRAESSALAPRAEAGTLETGPFPLGNLAWQVLPFGVGVAIAVVYSKVDVILLERMSSPTSLGLYSAAYRVLDAMMLIPRSLLGIAYPLFAHAWSRGTLSQGVLGRPARALVVVAFALAAGWWVLAGDLLRLVFGEPFVPGAAAARILALAVVPVFFNQYLGVVLNATHRQNQWLWVTACALAVNVGANLILIRLLDYRGAAWATVISEIFSLALFGRLVASRHGWPLPVSWLLRAALAALAMAGLVYFTPLPVALRIVLGAVAYLLIASWVGVIGRDDWAVIRHAGRRLMGRPSPVALMLPFA